MLAAKRRAVADLESYRQRRLGELQAQLAEYKATYTAAHPLIQGTRESMEALSRESPQLALLRREEQELVAQVAILAGAGGAGDTSGAVAAAVAPTPAPILLRELRARPARQGDSDDAETLRMRVNYAVQKYEAIVDRIESARIELDTARAAFKYRYTMVRPAEVPKKPIKPNVPLTLLSGVILGALLAFGASAWVEAHPPAVAKVSPAELKVVPAEAGIAAPEGHDDVAPSGTTGPV